MSPEVVSKSGLVPFKKVNITLAAFSQPAKKQVCQLVKLPCQTLWLPIKHDFNRT